MHFDNIEQAVGSIHRSLCVHIMTAFNKYESIIKVFTCIGILFPNTIYNNNLKAINTAQL